MGAAPEGPCDDGGGLDLASGQTRSNTADFLHRPADQHRLLRIIRRLLFGGAVVFALQRMAASIAKASMTSETCRCQPCQERVSLWSRLSSFLAVSVNRRGIGTPIGIQSGPLFVYRGKPGVERRLNRGS